MGGLAPHTRIEVFPNAGHFAHKDHPDRFVKVVHEFMRQTKPSTYHRGRVRRLLERGAPVPVRIAEAGEAPLRPVPAGA